MPINYYKLYWNIQVQWITNESIMLIIARVTAWYEVYEINCILFTKTSSFVILSEPKEELNFIYALACKLSFYFFYPFPQLLYILTSQVYTSDIL